MTELTNKVNEEIIMRELTINELESVNGGLCGWDITCGMMRKFDIHDCSLQIP